MGTYYGVKCVEQNGTLVGSHKPTVPILSTHVLVAVMFNGVWRIAVDVTSASELESFANEYSNGRWLRMTLYTISKDSVKQCVDKGRDYDVNYEK